MPIALLIIILLSWSFSSSAYVQNRTQADSLVHWNSNVSVVDIFVNSGNTQGILSADVSSQAANSVAQWNGKSRITIRQNSTASSNQENLNELFFSNDPSIFAGGTGVVGITQVFFKSNTGEMIEADILLNDNFNFSTDVNDANYLGNVITHEMGHFMGLGHSQVPAASMFYALSYGQSQIAPDDKAGVYSIYPTGDTTKGLITGKVIGGKSLTSVFGAHVQAISLKTGQISGASISDIDGSFTINGLSKNDQYYIYTRPIAIVGLPSRYNNVRFDYCNSSKKYRGSFFQSCGSSGEGYPQTVNLNTSSVNVGNITIRCNLDVPVEYMQGKDITPATFDLQTSVSSGVGNAFVGFFSSQDITLNSVDYFKLGYSGVDWDSLSAAGNLYVELKVLNQSFYSPFKANVSVKRSGVSTAVTPNYVQESDGALNLETIVRIPINRLVPSDNDIEISVTPEIMEFPSFPAGLPYTKADYFPAGSYFEDSLYFYLVTASIVRDDGGGTYTLVSYKNQVTTDNSSCPDAVNTYALTTYTANGTSSGSSKKRDDGGGCGTVDMSGGSGNGPGGFFIGLIFSLILYSLTTSIIKQYKAKHYSKLA